MFRYFLLDAWNSYINSETSIQFFMKNDWITCVSPIYLLPIFSLCTSSNKTSLSIKRCMTIPSRKGNHVRNTSSMHFLIGVQERWKVITFKLHRFWEGSRIFSTLSYPRGGHPYRHGSRSQRLSPPPPWIICMRRMQRSVTMRSLGSRYFEHHCASFSYTPRDSHWIIYRLTETE